jgi:hypothetical protein
LLYLLIFSSLVSAYYTAQIKLGSSNWDEKSLRLGMSFTQIKNLYGTPFAQNRNRITYILEDSSVLVITLRDETVSSAQLKYRHPLKIEDPEMRKLTLVQMQSEQNDSNQPSWFFAGKPEDGLIYKITSKGIVESLTWVPPFSYGVNQPKELHALLRDFQSRHSTKL